MKIFFTLLLSIVLFFKGSQSPKELVIFKSDFEIVSKSLLIKTYRTGHTDTTTSTGFLVANHGRYYFVTNYHVIRTVIA
jgi:hypothetical protein